MRLLMPHVWYHLLVDIPLCFFTLADVCAESLKTQPYFGGVFEGETQ